MSSDLQKIIVMPQDAGARLREMLGFSASDELRITFAAGYGDAARTFGHWKVGENDPSIPTIAYSLQFFELARQLDARAQIVGSLPVTDPSAKTDSRFRFDEVIPPAWTGRWSYYRSLSLHARNYVKTVRRFDPHIMIAGYTPLTWRPLARGRRLILTSHRTFWPMGAATDGPKDRIKKTFFAHCLRGVDNAVCISYECCRQIAELTDSRIKGEVAVPQIVNHHEVQKRTRARNLLYLGRIEDYKGVFLLFDAFERLADRHEDLTLTFAGDGGAEAALRSRQAVSKHGNRINVLGRLSSPEVHARLAASDVLVCPTMTSFNEGLAVVGFEAAAHGIPSVLSSVVPAKELLAECALVYRADDGNDLEHVLALLVEDGVVYRERAAATQAIRDKIYDRTNAWGSRLYRVIEKACA